MTTSDPTSQPPALDEAAAIMPEPGEAAGLSTSTSSADDLIARMADEQIDGLLDDPATDDAALAAVDDALEAASHTSGAGGKLVDAAASELREELAALNAAHPVPTSSMASPTEVSGTEVQVDSPHEEPAAPMEPAAPIEPAAPMPPSFNPPSHADVPTTAAVETSVIASETEASTGAEHSDADAVARELAADVAMLSTPLPAVTEHEAAAHAQPAEPWWKRAIETLLSVPMLLLAAVNVPARPLSDRGREVIGAIGVLTLVNAAGLLIYLAAFAHRHS